MIPISPEFIRTSASAVTLVLMFEENTDTNRIKITEIAVTVSTSLLKVFTKKHDSSWSTITEYNVFKEFQSTQPLKWRFQS